LWIAIAETFRTHASGDWVGDLRDRSDDVGDHTRCDPDVGKFEDVVVLKRFGDVPSDMYSDLPECAI
jgi:hypothetical protein